MDPIKHLSQKLQAERARMAPQQRPTPPDTAPPPYKPSDSGDDSDDDNSDNDTPSSQPLKLTINAAHSIQGSNNLVPTSPTPIADATKFSTLLLHAVHQINRATAGSTTKRPINIDLTINCGITVIGDRNVVGHVGLKPKSPAEAIAGPGAVMGKDVVVGAKRKVEEVSLPVDLGRMRVLLTISQELDDEREPKRMAASGTAGDQL